ncbi:MAG: zf-HC2 domain-containing protein [Planctomycetota bacterium]
MKKRRPSAAPETVFFDQRGIEDREADVTAQSGAVCAPFRERLSRYIDSELTPAEIVAFETHLQRCLACQRELLAEQRMVAQVIDALEPSAPTHAQTERLQRGFRAALARGAAQTNSRSWTIQASWAAAALVLISLGLTAIYTTPGKSSERTSDRALARHSTAPVAAPGVDADTSMPPTAEFDSWMDPPPEQVASTILLGDLDADGQFSAADVALLRRVIDGIPSKPACAAAGDFDGDRHLTPSDLSMASQALSTLLNFDRYSELSLHDGLACASVCP